MSCLTGQQHDLLRVSHPTCQNMCRSFNPTSALTGAMGDNSVNVGLKSTCPIMVQEGLSFASGNGARCNQIRVCLLLKSFGLQPQERTTPMRTLSFSGSSTHRLALWWGSAVVRHFMAADSRLALEAETARNEGCAATSTLNTICDAVLEVDSALAILVVVV